MPLTNTRSKIMLLTLLSFPALILTLYFTGAHLGWWMAGWLVSSLVYLAIFSWVAGGTTTEKNINDRSPRSRKKAD